MNIMKTRTTILDLIGPLAILAAITLMVACSGGATSGNSFNHMKAPFGDNAEVEGNTGTRSDQGSAAAAAGHGQAQASDEGTAAAIEGNGDAQAGDRYDALGRMDPNGNYDVNGNLLDGVLLQPEQERNDAIERMNGVKAKLTAELNEVRDRLKDGTLDKDVAAAYREQAADLGQGLERVNRTLKAMGEATDATWSEMRNSELKEVNEVRAWWRGYVAKQQEVSAGE